MVTSFIGHRVRKENVKHGAYCHTKSPYNDHKRTGLVLYFLNYDSILPFQLLESIGVKDQYFSELKSWVANVLVPHQKELLKPTSNQEAASLETANSCTQVVPPATHRMEHVLYKLLEAATSNPREVMQLRSFTDPTRLLFIFSTDL